MRPIEVGATHTARVIVDESLTVPAVSDKFVGFSTMPRVFATAFLVGFAEATAMGVLADYLDASEGSVGVDVRFDHIAATPIGLTVTATATVTDVQPRLVTFAVELSDNAGPIGRGTHVRAIIDRAAFEARVEAKALKFAQ